jgi:acyl carrier protein
MMSAKEVQNVFVESLGVAAETDWNSLAYRGVEEWDSVAHMVLVGELEDAFDIMIDTQDVIDMSSYAEVLRILAKYGVDVW